MKNYRGHQLMLHFTVAKPTEKNLNAVKWIFQYLKGTINMGLWYLKDTGMSMTAYADADHAGLRAIYSQLMKLLGCALLNTLLSIRTFHFFNHWNVNSSPWITNYLTRIANLAIHDVTFVLVMRVLPVKIPSSHVLSFVALLDGDLLRTLNLQLSPCHHALESLNCPF
ncbi:hypothetical protein Tco_0486901 [Tanacetum coccineum]